MRRLILLLAVLGCEVKKEQQPCGEAVITDEGIGELRIGVTVESVRQKCTVVSDKTAPGAGGMPASQLTVALARDTVEAEIVNGRVWRLAVHSPRLLTAD